MALWTNIFRSKKPEFWLDYEQQFDNTSLKERQLSNTRFVVLDTETTGFHLDVDRIISIGAVQIIQGEILVNTAFEKYIHQAYFNENTVEIHGILKEDKRATTKEEDIIPPLLNYIGNAIIVAHHAAFDIDMINALLRRYDLPKLKNRVLDTAKMYEATKIKTNLRQSVDASLDNIAEEYHLDVSDRHTAAGDALLTALIFLQTFQILHKKKGLSLRQMVRKYGR